MNFNFAKIFLNFKHNSDKPTTSDIHEYKKRIFMNIRGYSQTLPASA